MKSTIKKLIYTILILYSITISTTIVNAEEIDEPIELDYLLPSEEWTFIDVTDLIANQTINFEWLSDVRVNGKEVTYEQYQLMLGMSFSERLTYFETIGFTAGKFDNGRITTDASGRLFFVFYNPEQEDANIHFIITSRNQKFEPWVIGLITGLTTSVVLALSLIAIIIIRNNMIKKQMEEEKKSPAQRYLEM
ncbi:MAG: hypothetical protein FK730_16760 [Asgard group archaeon]|nr:hypothetical protein [Asgard group archaeon]